MVELIIQYFWVKRYPNDSNYKILCDRQHEYTYCLKKNLSYNAINKIHILLEDEKALETLVEEGIDIKHEKINLVKFYKRMNYKDAFEYANKNLPNKIIVVLHTDIYLENGFENLKLENMSNKMYALARTNNVNGLNTGRGIRIKKIPNKKGNYCCTFDGWCLKTPISEKIIKDTNHQQNVWGAENKLIYTFKINNYQVLTPNILKLVHWHMSDIRPNQNWNWITSEGKLIPHNSKLYFDKLKGNPFVVGGGIPLELGTSLITNDL